MKMLMQLYVRITYVTEQNGDKSTFSMGLLNAIRLKKSTTLRGNAFHMLTTRSLHSPLGSPYFARFTSSQSPHSLSPAITTPSAFYSRLNTHLFWKRYESEAYVLCIQEIVTNGTDDFECHLKVSQLLETPEWTVRRLSNYDKLWACATTVLTWETWSVI